MASKTCTEKCGTQIKGGTISEAQFKIAQKLQSDFEKDILRLFQDSVYCDVKFTVHSSSLLAHSCILLARASTFYKFVRAEFEVVEDDGISVYNICNASFPRLQTFVENIYTNLHSFHAEEKIIKHLKESKSETLEIRRVERPATSARTPESDLFFTPKCSPSELQKPFGSSKFKVKDNDVASYYKIASVDDFPADEKLEESNGGDPAEERALEKELAEQDELLSSFQTILSKKVKTKPSSLSLGASSQSARKTKPKFNRKFEANLLLVDDRKKCVLPHWKPNPVGDRPSPRDRYLGVKAGKKNPTGSRPQEKVDSTGYLEEASNSVCSSDMDVSTTGGDSGLEVSLNCQQEASPREATASETSGVDLTEAAINEDIPNDETISTKRSSGSSASSEAGTWDANDDTKARAVAAPAEPGAVRGDPERAAGRHQLDQDEINRLDEMERNMRDCEMFLYMERKASLREEPCQSHSATDDDVPGSLNDPDPFNCEDTYQYAGEKAMSNPEECTRGETEHRQNHDGEENYYKYGYCDEKNSDDAITPEDKNYEKVDANESPSRGGAGDSINSNSDYFVQPDILRDVQDAKTPPCTPKKSKGNASDESETRDSEGERKARHRENNNPSGVSNYFIDAASLLDETEIPTPPISLISFRSPRGFDENETDRKAEAEDSKTVSKKVVSNFYNPDSSEEASLIKEKERRQGDIIFKSSIPHYSKHEIDDSYSVDTSEGLRGGGENSSSVEDESEQVVPSADIELSPPGRKQEREKCSYLVQSDYFEPRTVSSDCESEPSRDHAESEGVRGVTAEPPPRVRDPAADISSSSMSSGSPNLRRRNESAPIVSGGMDYVEEEKRVQKKPSQCQGEAWIVTFDDEKKRNRLTESRTENGEDGKLHSVHIGRRRREQEVQEGDQESRKVEQRGYPVQKSNSSGYFLDFSKDSGEESVEQASEVKTEKKNMFSMFIGMDDNSNSTFLRRAKPTIEREGTFDKSLEESSRETTKSETPEDRKKPFYMFIESDSPNVKRRQVPRRSNREQESAGKRNLLRTQSYTIEQESTKPEVKTDFECSSSDNSLPYPESNFRSDRPVRGKLPLPLNKFREPKLTAWSETKHPTGGAAPAESWLRSKDVQVNYRGKVGEGVHPKKDPTSVTDDDNEHSEGERSRETKPRERDSGVVLSDKGDDSFVKLSDLDSSGRPQGKSSGPSCGERMSKSISEGRKEKSFSSEETRLSKSIGGEGTRTNGKGQGLYERGVNQSLSRLFPNLNAQSLARMGRKDGDRAEGDVQGSEMSEVSSSMQSSVEPSGLEISTSETDVSTHVGTTSKLGEDLLKMFLEEISPDVVIEVNGRRIKAHKCILSSRCQYFAAMLSGGWVESAGNVISLQGFSYNAVHFALRHIYSGESRIPESLSIVELATLADMLCLDGLQEIISYNLKVKYCHSFHVPCSVCSVGVIDCLPIAAAYGLDDLYRKCLRWITKYFVKIWPTKCFGSLPKELLEKCYQHYVVHMTVDNVLDTIVSIDKVRGSLPNVRWAESVSRLVNKLHGATVKYIAEHFSSVLTSDNFLALGKEAGWNVSRLEDSLIETVRYLPPEQACWSHARLHRILSVATGPDPPPEMNWNENFLKLLQLIAELVENSLIKQAPRAAKSKAWRQMEPELRSRIQEAACLVLPDQEQTSAHRRSNYVKKENGSAVASQTAKNRNFEIRQIKLAMSQQQQTTNKNPTTKRPLSLQMDQRPKKDSRFIPLRPSVSTSSVRRTEPRTEGIRKTQSRSQILGNTTSEPKKTINPRYSEVKSRYLEPKSPLKSASDKPASDANQRRTFRYISSSDSSRNCSPSLRTSHSRSSIPQAKKPELPRQTRSSVLRSGSASALHNRRDKTSSRADGPSVKSLNRLTKEENLSTDSLCTDSLASEKEATIRRRSGKENLGERILGNSGCKSSSNSPVSRRHSSESWSSATSKTSAVRKAIAAKPQNEVRSNPPRRGTGRVPGESVPTPNPSRLNVSSPRTAATATATARRNQRNAGRIDPSLVNGNVSRKPRGEVDAENNKKNPGSPPVQPTAVERSGTFLKDEPTILKKPQVGAEA